MARTNRRPSFIAGADLDPYRQVKFDGTGQAIYTAANDPPLGSTAAKAATGDAVAVIPWNESGVQKAVANEAFAALANLYVGANGKVQATDPGSGTIRFVALEASTGDGSIVSVIRKPT
ncbi:MAG: hypothetical protein AB7Q17_15835 [Phycisphaerae bacterium]